MQSPGDNQGLSSGARHAGGINPTARRSAHEGCMDQSIATIAKAAPRGFLRDWVLTVLWPALGCGGLAGLLIRDDLRLEDAAFIYLLGLPAVYWFLAGLLQGRLLGALIERPWAWAVATWGGGCLALIGGFVSFGVLTLWIAAISRAGYDFAHPFALLPFGVSGIVAGGILGFCQALTLHVSWRERRHWIAGSKVAGAAAFLVQWLGVNAAAFMSDSGAFELAQTPFIAMVAGSLLAGALLHNLLTGIALRRLLARCEFI
jgi:hypothetical protein